MKLFPNFPRIEDRSCPKNRLKEKKEKDRKKKVKDAGRSILI